MALASFPQAVEVSVMAFGNPRKFEITLAASDDRSKVAHRIQSEIGFCAETFTMILYCAPVNDADWNERVTNDLLALMNGEDDAKRRHMTHEAVLPWNCSLYSRVRGHVCKVQLVVELVRKSSSPQSSLTALASTPNPPKETDPLLPDQTGATAHAVPAQSPELVISNFKNACWGCARKLGLLFVYLTLMVLTVSVAALLTYFASRILPRFVLKMLYVVSALVQAAMAIAKLDERGDRDWGKICAAAEQVIKAMVDAWNALLPLS